MFNESVGAWVVEGLGLNQLKTYKEVYKLILLFRVFNNMQNSFVLEY